MKRILSLLVALALVLSMAPSVFAATGTPEDPIDLTSDLLYENDFSATVTVPAGTTHNFVAYRVGGMTMTINGGEPVACTTAGMMAPYTWTIENSGAEAAEYVIVVAYPTGSQMNPAELVTGTANYAAVEAGNTQGYYYNWTAPAAGTLTIEMYASDANWNPLGWSYVINNMTTYVYGDTQWSDSDPVVNPGTATVAAGDVIEIIVNTYDPADMWNNPAGDVSVTATFTCAEHGETEASDNYDGTTHSNLCKVCGTAVSIENHTYVEGVCACGVLIPGTEANPHDLTNDLLYDNDFTATVTVAAGTTYYCQAYRVGGMTMTINGGEPVACTTAGMMAPYTWTIENSGAEAAEYVIVVAYPTGSQMNPAELVTGTANYAAVEAGNTQGYYYNWTAPAAGTLTIEMYASDANWNPLGWSYVINNMTTYVYGDTQWSDSDPVVNPGTATVAAGDVIEIIVNTYDPADMWNNPAGDVSVTATFTCAEHGETTLEDNYDGTHSAICIACGATVSSEEHTFVDGVCACDAQVPGTEANPIDLTNDLIYEEDLAATVTVPANTTYYFMSYGLAGMNMTINGGEAVLCTGNPRMPYTWSITNDGAEDAEYVITVAAPVGTMDNPAELTIGENAAVIEAGSQGYFYTWTAAENGELTITMPEGDWTYAVNNLTTYAYGDTQWSDSDPVLPSYTVAVAAGDEIQIIVNTYDPENLWGNPEGTITFTAAFAGAAPQNGWNEEDGKWCYYENGTKVTNTWKKDYIGWCYLGADGYMVTNGWAQDSHGWCYLGADGYMITNARAKDSHGWCYMGADGYMVYNQWAKDAGGWSYVGADGYCVTNTWKKDSTGWCYLGADGYMVINNWAKDSAGWCYLGDDGYCVTNSWKQDSRGWCYLGADGRMVYNQWVKDSVGWCYVGADGYMVVNDWAKDSTGWCFMGEDGYIVYNDLVLDFDNEKIYYVDESGYMVSNKWIGEGNEWIYFGADGALVVSDWVYYNGEWYFIDEDGFMLYNCTVRIDGVTYTFNASGVLV